MSLRGKSVCTVSFFYEKAPLSSVPLFKERGAAVCFLRFWTHRCRGMEANELLVLAFGPALNLLRGVQGGGCRQEHRSRLRRFFFFLINLIIINIE